jgi:hypothetical protein
MKTCKVKLEVEVEVNAFTMDDAADIATETIYDMEGLGVTVIDVTVTDRSET